MKQGFKPLGTASSVASKAKKHDGKVKKDKFKALLSQIKDDYKLKARLLIRRPLGDCRIQERLLNEYNTKARLLMRSHQEEPIIEEQPKKKKRGAEVSIEDLKREAENQETEIQETKAYQVDVRQRHAQPRLQTSRSTNTIREPTAAKYGRKLTLTGRRMRIDAQNALESTSLRMKRRAERDICDFLSEIGRPKKISKKEQTETSGTCDSGTSQRKIQRGAQMTGLSADFMKQFKKLRICTRYKIFRVGEKVQTLPTSDIVSQTSTT